MADPLDGYVRPDFTLKGDAPYVYWRPGDKSVTLDGDFDADELRAFADHMDSINKNLI